MSTTKKKHWMFGDKSPFSRGESPFSRGESPFSRGESPFSRGKPPFFRGVRLAGMVVFGIVAAAVFALVFGILVMLLWNWLMPLIFGLPEITYWQAFGIVILVKLIFGTLGHGKHDHDRRQKWGPDTPAWEHFWQHEGDTQNWRYWHEFWKDEGKHAFEKYIERREAEESPKPGEEV